MTSLPPLLTATEVESLSGQPTNDVIEAQCELLSRLVREYCGWHIAPVIADDRVSVDLPRWSLGSWEAVLLPSLRVLEVTTVVCDGVEVDRRYWRASEPGILDLRGLVRPRQSLVVTLTHGHDQTPAQVALVIVTALARMNANPAGVTSERLGDYQVTYGTSEASVGAMLSFDEQAQLRRFQVRDDAS